MSDEPIGMARAGVPPSVRSGFWGTGRTHAAHVSFERRELNSILNIYGRMVIAGEWRDYAIDFLEDAAVFSIFRRSAEMALYRVEKRPKLRHRQGQFSLIAAGGQILKRGHDLKSVLQPLERRLLKAVAAE